ncbi:MULTISPECIES: LysR substrate-binding domain-containing protein [unclassified Rhizobium]|uniref:LysR substrate-binding domain-containing protein n=1 Tax=unclassified Rhizobium TaxID=2613769 RepID=UPI000CDF31F3|nr:MULTISPECIES: LysR substrate-binding domain-containing protein [Rhizobium]AVA22225.1 LysR family transcriptional regulator protein [Rhizobium sp. NXC24]MDK4738716.1 LysR substrate-binding domain-containing protein [Rhizobium sp. CNPSo 3464]UWU19672.1 LysR substrate-binding domain-containing protein [Rhizobium tropici]
MGKRPLPPLAVLQAFCAIVETGGFGRAAERMGLTQTAVSHQLSQLEGWIGGRLFDRGRSGARLTPLGARLHPAIVETISQLETALYHARASVSVRTLTLSVTPEFSSQWLASRLGDFCQRHPDIELKMIVGYQRPDFGPEGVDLAIWLGRAEAGLVQEELLTDEEFVVSSPTLSERLPKRNAIKEAPLLRYTGMRHTVLDWQRWYEQVIGHGNDGGMADFNIGQAAENGPLFESFADMLGACRDGLGFALVRSSLVAKDLAEGQLVRCFVEVQPAAVSYNLIYPSNALQNPSAALFRTWLISRVNAVA